jgi:hypothetical protein
MTIVLTDTSSIGEIPAEKIKANDPSNEEDQRETVAKNRVTNPEDQCAVHGNHMAKDLSVKDIGHFIIVRASSGPQDNGHETKLRNRLFELQAAYTSMIKTTVNATHHHLLLSRSSNKTMTDRREAWLVELKNIFDKASDGDQITPVTNGNDGLVTNCTDFFEYFSLYVNKVVLDLVIFMPNDMSTYSVALLCSTIEKVLNKTISIEEPDKYISLIQHWSKIAVSKAE